MKKKVGRWGPKKQNGSRITLEERKSESDPPGEVGRIRNEKKENIPSTHIKRKNTLRNHS